MDCAAKATPTVFGMPERDHHTPRTVLQLQHVQAVTIQRPAGVGLLIRVLPGGSWRLREYDCNGDEEGRGGA